MTDRVIPQGGRYLKPESACNKLDRGRSWLWERVKNDPTFPRPIYIDHKSPLFLESEIDRWIAERAAKSERAPGRAS